SLFANLRGCRRGRVNEAIDPPLRGRCPAGQRGAKGAGNKKPGTDVAAPGAWMLMAAGPKAGRETSEHEVGRLQVDVPRDLDREVGIAVAVDITIDEGAAVHLFVAQLARRVGEVVGTDEVEGGDTRHVDHVALAAA